MDELKLKIEDNINTQRTTQPYSRGSPRPRGYVHQIISRYINSSLKEVQ